MNALLAFECAATTRSFSAAARAMGTSQPSVSRHISNLEAHLGCKLFHRHNNKITLTAEGRTLRHAASASFEALRAAVAEISPSRRSGVVTIGCTHGFSHLWIMPRFSSLKSLFNDWEIRIVTSESGEVFDPEEIDFSVQFCDRETLAPQGTRLFDEEVLLVASPEFIARNSPPSGMCRVEWLRQAPLIHLDDGEEKWMSWREWFADHGIVYQPPGDTYFFRNYAFSLQAAAEGKGIALAWKELLGSYQENGWLKVLDYRSRKSAGSYRLVYAEDWGQHPVGAQIVSWFGDEVSKGAS